MQITIRQKTISSLKHFLKQLQKKLKNFGTIFLYYLDWERRELLTNLKPISLSHREFCLVICNTEHLTGLYMIKTLALMC